MNLTWPTDRTESLFQRCDQRYSSVYDQRERITTHLTVAPHNKQTKSSKHDCCIQSRRLYNKAHRYQTWRSTKESKLKRMCNQVSRKNELRFFIGFWLMWRFSYLRFSTTLTIKIFLLFSMISHESCDNCVWIVLKHLTTWSCNSKLGQYLRHSR